jgi:ppGpp synthetase/RelA/SpoT-type nucleotidyltranferase
MKRDWIREGYEDVRPRFEEAVELMTVHVRFLLRSTGILSPGELEHRVTGRVKTSQSCFLKIRRIEKKNRRPLRGWHEVLAQVDDIAGIRVVLNYLDELPAVYAYLRRHPSFREIAGKFEDYVQNPKVGYRALHSVFKIRTTFGPAKCEVQVRTALQDAWAAKSHALLYKLKKTELERLPAGIKKLIAQQSDLLYNMDQMAGELADMTRAHLTGNP